MSDATSMAGRSPSGSDRYRRNPRVAQQLLGGKAVILHYEGRRILGLNRSGTRVWELLDGASTLDDIARETALQSGAPAGTAADDVKAFVAELLRRDLVECCGPEANDTTNETTGL